MGAGRRGLPCCCKLQPCTSPCSKQHCLGEGLRQQALEDVSLEACLENRRDPDLGLEVGWKRGDAEGLLGSSLAPVWQMVWQSTWAFVGARCGQKLASSLCGFQ